MDIEFRGTMNSTLGRILNLNDEAEMMITAVEVDNMIQLEQSWNIIEHIFGTDEETDAVLIINRLSNVNYIVSPIDMNSDDLKPQVFHLKEKEYYNAVRVVVVTTKKMCSICQDNIKGAAHRLECSHVFHPKCLKTYLCHKCLGFPCCPNCRFKIKK
jgi:hypothetical protein